jgi:integrative and conjugative element protein (TIGR02256 family)
MSDGMDTSTYCAVSAGRRGEPSIFRKSDAGRLEIGQHALARMLAFVQSTPRKTEAGGVLLGRYLLESTDIVIDGITIPMPGDCRSRSSFYRDHRRHQQAIDRAWRESGGTCAYLGEWHTHPERRPLPSGTDRREWRRKLREDVFDGDRLYFIVVGIESLRVWEGIRSSLECRLIGEYLHAQGDGHVEDEDSA